MLCGKMDGARLMAVLWIFNKGMMPLTLRFSIAISFYAGNEGLEFLQRTFVPPSPSHTSLID